jgi:hypothetical protein
MFEEVIIEIFQYTTTNDMEYLDLTERWKGKQASLPYRLLKRHHSRSVIIVNVEHYLVITGFFLGNASLS